MERCVEQGRQNIFLILWLVQNRFKYVTVLKHTKLHSHTWKKKNLIPLQGKQKEITVGFVSHSVGSKRRGIKRTVKRHISECVCWGMSMGLRVCILCLEVFSLSFSSRWRSEGRRMACVPLAVERCVVPWAETGCFLDAAMAKIVQDSSLQKFCMKKKVNKEKKPHELSFCPSNTHTHNPTQPSVSMPQQRPCMMWWTRQPGTVPTTSAGSLENNRGVKMSDRHLTTHTAVTYKWK